MFLGKNSLILFTEKKVEAFFEMLLSPRGRGLMLRHGFQRDGTDGGDLAKGGIEG